MIGRVLVDLELNDLKFRLNDEEVIFDMRQSLKQPKKMSIFLVIGVTYADDLVVPIEERFIVETLAIVLMNLNSKEINEYNMTVCALLEWGRIHMPLTNYTCT